MVQNSPSWQGRCQPTRVVVLLRAVCFVQFASCSSTSPFVPFSHVSVDCDVVACLHCDGCDVGMC